MSTRRNYATVVELTQRHRFEEAKLELIDLSLIMITEDTGLMSVHRLIQEAYFDKATEMSRVSGFGMILSLLREAFPRNWGTQDHFYKHWAACEALHQHVQALHKVFTRMRTDGYLKPQADYQDLLLRDIW